MNLSAEFVSNWLVALVLIALVAIEVVVFIVAFVIFLDVVVAAWCAVGRGFAVLTRSARCVSNYADVPRLGARPKPPP
jgi:hypothetical protein